MIRKPTWIDAYKSANPKQERDMEKINIAEILKDCPSGMELDCTMYENVTLVNVYEGYAFPIKISTPEGKCVLSQYGCYALNKEAKCVIFPKGKTTWEGFVPPCKFKVGDKIVKRGSIENSWIVCSVSSEYYGLKLPNGSENIGVLLVSEQDDWELVPNKFDISTLKPFESRVLVRQLNGDYWRPAFWGCYNKQINPTYPFLTTFGTVRQCVPYENNEHLLRTNDNCDDFYKTWEEQQ